MKNSKHILTMLVLVAVSAGANAQCAMCRAALENSEGTIKAEGVNNGIMYLMVIPYLLVAIIGYAVYRLRMKKKTAK